MSSVEKLEGRPEAGIEEPLSHDNNAPTKKRSPTIRGSLSIAVFFLTMAAGYVLMFLILERLLQG